MVGPVGAEDRIAFALQPVRPVGPTEAGLYRGVRGLTRPAMRIVRDEDRTGRLRRGARLGEDVILSGSSGDRLAGMVAVGSIVGDSAVVVVLAVIVSKDELKDIGRRRWRQRDLIAAVAVARQHELAWHIAAGDRQRRDNGTAVHDGESAARVDQAGRWRIDQIDRVAHRKAGDRRAELSGRVELRGAGGVEEAQRLPGRNRALELGDATAADADHAGIPGVLADGAQFEGVAAGDEDGSVIDE